MKNLNVFEYLHYNFLIKSYFLDIYELSECNHANSFNYLKQIENNNNRNYVKCFLNKIKMSKKDSSMNFNTVSENIDIKPIKETYNDNIETSESNLRELHRKLSYIVANCEEESNDTNCGHDDFPFCECLHQSITRQGSFSDPMEDFYFGTPKTSSSIKIESDFEEIVDHEKLNNNEYSKYETNKESQILVKEHSSVETHINYSKTDYSKQNLEKNSETQTKDIVLPHKPIEKPTEPISTFSISSQSGCSTRRRTHDFNISLNSFRETKLDAFDETEESCFHELADLSDAEGGSDVEGAAAAPPSQDFLIIPQAPGARRASVVTCDSRRPSQIITSDVQPIKIAAFGKDGVGKSGKICLMINRR